ncbi:ArsR/SmtB family transcription factor [Neisseria animalis]|uniref:ArsR family transcriptional regulator n=1 Tax=Neisseria animalis TaxID=492 RepID=A0A5P3MSA3_NEIAN|nr:ArsR family transcriptional regulator [Neisseria animalis]QEY24330.1 ArsR family transcriptional regulator [Neisseria animalis]ROW32269.1 ArsR family transcriptional regulator [Neisseria animalis]VEE06800.1 ArsR family transcriptional regulator [Neisseria animalis]
MENHYFTTLLRLIAQPERMKILFTLLDGDRNINELAQTLKLPATVVSNHLAKMRSEGIVDYTRYHRVLEYRLISADTAAILNTLRNLPDKRQHTV